MLVNYLAPSFAVPSAVTAEPVQTRRTAMAETPTAVIDFLNIPEYALIEKTPSE